jgi:hypothetical protein
MMWSLLESKTADGEDLLAALHHGTRRENVTYQYLFCAEENYSQFAWAWTMRIKRLAMNVPARFWSGLVLLSVGRVRPSSKQVQTSATHQVNVNLGMTQRTTTFFKATSARHENGQEDY